MSNVSRRPQRRKSNNALENAVFGLVYVLVFILFAIFALAITIGPTVLLIWIVLEMLKHFGVIG